MLDTDLNLTIADNLPSAIKCKFKLSNHAEVSKDSVSDKFVYEGQVYQVTLTFEGGVMFSKVQTVEFTSATSKGIISGRDSYDYIDQTYRNVLDKNKRSQIVTAFAKQRKATNTEAA